MKYTKSDGRSLISKRIYPVVTGMFGASRGKRILPRWTRLAERWYSPICF
ncbi:MAG: hypothetical protein LH472_07945 [Pyrinomonadaceae bacterium]|nr:hypothetical protein [Pyrinomonadaceae bacterium]